jgi:hypothetical protein
MKSPYCLYPCVCACVSVPNLFIFYAVPVVSKESKRLVLRIFCLFLGRGETQLPRTVAPNRLIAPVLHHSKGRDHW